MSVKHPILACLLVAAAHYCHAAETDHEDWNAHVQATYVWQTKPEFSAAYSGPNSLGTQHEKSYSFTATAALGLRPWQDGEIYLNPECAQGIPFSNLTGLGGFTNGEIARTAGATLKCYRARLFLRQTWGLGGGREKQESDANQLAGSVDKHRVVLTAGNLSVGDIFDDNVYSHDPRTQFMNWSIMTHGAYDYAADARGYTWGMALEYYSDDWVLRAGRFTQAREPNAQRMDFQIAQNHGDQIELEHAHELDDLPGKLRLLLYRNRAPMARFADATGLGALTGATPDLNLVRKGYNTRWGMGLNLEQALSANTGLFARASWSDGKTETYNFTEIDRSASTGLLLKGAAWGREADNLGIAMAWNGLSKQRRDYLAAGGISFFIGDGRLNYDAEKIFETFYSLALGRAGSLSVDWQHIRNPAYNADRGPVRVGSLRLHTEF
ncbi:MAG: carbohydrate porin [Rhodocyclaceae bacterium]|nr:MAG: carbohydrate porin [Rhodocyclaceae bacterium]